MRVLDFVEQTNNAATPDELAGLFRHAISQCGYDRFAYGALTNYSRYNFLGPFQPPAIIVEYPPEWVAHYFDQKYDEVDPIITRSPGMRWPFLWSDLINLTDKQHRFMNEAKEAGLDNGICIPIHGPYGDTFAISYGSDNPEAAPRVVLDHMHLLAAQFHTAFLRMATEDQMAKPPVSLSPRECECLIWSARGKSSWDIGVILSISEHTVNFHIKSAMEKLGAGSRILAIVKALRMGLILP